MKKVTDLLVKCFLLFFLGTAVGFLLVVLAYMLPLNAKTIDSTCRILENESVHLQVSVPGVGIWDQWNSILLPDVLDSGSDGVMLYMAMDEGEGSLLVRAMNSYNHIMLNYSYYWHGYLFPLRLLMIAFDYSEIRIINCAGQMLLITLLVYLIGRKKGIRYVFMFITSYILLMPLALQMSLQFSWVFYIAHVGLLVFLLKQEYFSVGNRYIYYFLILGMLTGYMDLLTYPLFVWGMNLIWQMILSEEEKEELQWIRQVIFSGISWVIGYAGLWVMKWILGSLILGRNLFESAFEEIVLRSGSGLQGEGGLTERFSTIYINWRHYQHKVYELILICWLAWWILQFLHQGGWSRDTRRKAFLLVGFSGIVWYFVLANHTLTHNYFTYRIYGVSVLAFLGLILISTEKTEHKIKLRWFYGVPLLCLVGVLAFFLMRQTREEVLAINGEEEYQKIPLEGTAEMEFSPTFNVIRGISLGLEGDGGEGLCRITVWDGEKPLYQEIFKLEEIAEGNFHGKTVEWKLNHRKAYRMTLEVEEASSPVYLWVTTGATTLIEWSDHVIADGVSIAGQPLSGIVYMGRPTLAEIRNFMVLTWVGILLSVIYAFWPKNGRNIPFFQNRKTIG